MEDITKNTVSVFESDDTSLLPEAPMTDTEYTKIENASCDIKTVRILRDLLSSKVSVLSAYNTYLYQSFIGSTSPLFLSKIKQILLQKLNQIELLSSAIIDFGGAPIFRSPSGQFWSARYVNYSTNPQSFIADNIRQEQALIKKIERASALIKNESLKSLLAEIANENQKQISVFETFR